MSDPVSGAAFAPREVAPGVHVATAQAYTTTTTIVAGADGGCLLIDPAVTVADLEALAGWLGQRSLRPVAAWSTHPHWDHVLWSAALGRRRGTRLPGRPLWPGASGPDFSRACKTAPPDTT